MKVEMNKLEVQKPIEIWEDIDLVQKETDILIATANVKKDILKAAEAIKDLQSKHRDYKSSERRLSDILEESVKVTHIPKRKVLSYFSWKS